jgi:hypothetical protein
MRFRLLGPVEAWDNGSLIEARIEDAQGQYCLVQPLGVSLSTSPQRHVPWCPFTGVSP